MTLGNFHGNPIIEDLPGPRDYRIRQSSDEWFGYLTSDDRWIIPDNGTLTDQGSVPTPLTPFLARDQFKGFYIHDYVIRGKGYAMHSRDDNGNPYLAQIIAHVPMTRLECDVLLYECVLTEGAPRWLAWLILKGVRRGSWRSYYGKKWYELLK